MTVMIDDGAVEPGTHVLIIGIGDYPYLDRGSAKPSDSFPDHMGMGQLTSPPFSARALADWFSGPQAGFHNSTRPLRSLSMLISQAHGLAEWNGKQVERAQTKQVEDEIVAWLARGNRNPENMTIFYFCGHGLAWGETENSLLLEDFGANHQDPMSLAIAFDELKTGLLKRCAAKYQCHFIDACRSSPDEDFIDKYGAASTGRAIVSAGVRRERGKTAPIFFATTLGTAAYGLDRSPSLFTQGLLSSFRGNASRQQQGGWAVTVGAMAEGINKYCESLYESQPQFCQQRDTGFPFILHELTTPPEVIVKVTTQNGALLAATVLAHTIDGVRVMRTPPRDLPWWVTLTLGTYKFEALSQVDLAIVAAMEKSVQPPGVEVVL